MINRFFIKRAEMTDNYNNSLDSLFEMYISFIILHI